MNTTHSMEQTGSQTKTKANATSEISKISVAVMAFSAAVIGCWATACLFAGAISSGGPMGLVQNLIATIIG